MGSSDVIVNKRPALRVDDRGIHMACCGTNSWVAKAGSGTVFINNKPAHRMGDQSRHCGGIGQLIEGSTNVIVGGGSVGGGGGGAAGGGGASAGAGGGGGGGGGAQSERSGGGGGGAGESARSSRGGAQAGAGAAAGSDAGGAEVAQDRKDWVAIEVVDNEGKPAAMIRYKVTGPDGAEQTGLTGSDGKARIEGLTPGECTVTFPDLHAGEWERG